MRRSRHCGFSLIELLVVIGIITVLFGILLPAIQKTRETANRTKCMNNLRQLGIATANYHAAYGYMPSGGEVTGQMSSGSSPQFAGTNYFMRLAPFLEQTSGYLPWDTATYNVVSCSSWGSPIPSKTSYGYYGVKRNQSGGIPRHSVLAQPYASVTLRKITNCNGTTNTALLAHCMYVRMSFSRLDYAPDNTTLARDYTPHQRLVPTVFCDSSVRNLPLDFYRWTTVWNFANTSSVINIP